MGLFGARWLFSRLFSRKFRQQLNASLQSPAAFYYAALMKIVPGLHRGRIDLPLKNGGKISVRSFMTLYIFEEIFLDRVYDRHLKTQPSSIIDIGANTGLFVLRAKQLWPHATVLAFEPEPGNYAELLYTIENNHLTHVTAVNAAIANEAGPVTLYRHPRNAGGHSIVHHVGADAVTVSASTMDDALARLGGGCDLLKIDCEGSEEGILRGLTPDQARQIGAIVYEPDWGSYSVNSLNDWLSSLGFTVFGDPDVVVAVHP